MWILVRFFASITSTLARHMIWILQFGLSIGTYNHISHLNKVVFLTTPSHLNDGRSYAKSRRFGTGCPHNAMAFSHCHPHCRHCRRHVPATIAYDVLAYDVENPALPHHDALAPAATNASKFVSGVPTLHKNQEKASLHLLDPMKPRVLGKLIKLEFLVFV